jgi:phosphomannomutase/phosphoglucomutase
VSKSKLLSGQPKMLVILLVVAILAVAIASIVLLPKKIDTYNREKMGKIGNEMAALQVKALNNQIEQLNAALLARAMANGITEVLQQGDASVMQSASEKLQVVYADLGVQQVKLIPFGSNYSTMGLRFAHLDRMSLVERGLPVYPEAFEEKGKKLFDILVPVKGENSSIRGSLLVVVDIGVLEKSMGNVNPLTAETVLQQKFERGKNQVVFRLGGGKNMEYASQPAESTVPHWKIIVIPTPDFLSQTIISSAAVYIFQGIVIVASMLCLFFLNKKMSLGSFGASGTASHDHDTPIQIKGARKIDKSVAVSSASTGDDETDFAVAESLADPMFQSGDVFDLDFNDDAFDVAPKPVESTLQPSTSSAGAENFPAPLVIFRDYDIRGHADRELTDELATRIGRAYGSECIEKGHKAVVLAGDGRLSTPRLKAAVQQGLLASGCDVVDIGIVPTPLMNFATNIVSGVTSGIMVTGSHNPASDNGFKMVIDGRTLASEQISAIYDRVRTGRFCSGAGDCREQDIIADYIEHIASDIVLAGSYKVVVDAGNGIAGIVAPQLLEELGCDVVPLYCDVDGSFPNHAPDPSVLENLNDLIAKVSSEGADLGVAFDGDGDRLAVVTSSGAIILPDRLLMLFAKDVVSRNPGTDVIFDVKSTRRLNALISSCGGRPVMWKSGHSHIKNKMLETGAMLGGELSGHIFFKERWFGFDDGMYSAARLLEIMSIRDQDLDGIFATFPDAASTPEIKISVPEDRKFAIVKQLGEKGDWGNGKLISIDGVRVDFAKGWGLVRASNTSAALTLRFEADDVETLATVQQVFKQQLQLVDSSLAIPF